MLARKICEKPFHKVVSREGGREGGRERGKATAGLAFKIQQQPSHSLYY
jgi:hypothetical protein